MENEKYDVIDDILTDMSLDAAVAMYDIVPMNEEGCDNLAPLLIPELLSDVEERIQHLLTNNKKAKYRVLNIIALTDDPASKVYMNNKAKVCSKFGIICKIHKVENNVELLKLLDDIKSNTNNRVIVQYPYDENKFMPLQRIFEILPKHMDVDGFSMSGLDVINMSNSSKHITFNNIMTNPNVSPTSKGVIGILGKQCLNYLNICNDYSDYDVTLIGKGLTSGLPLSNLLPLLGYNVRIAHSRTSSENLDNMIVSSDIVISCAGSPGIVNVTNPSHIKPATYINVGMSKCDKTDKMLPDISPCVDRHRNVAFRNELFGTTGKLTTMFLLYNVLL